MPWGNKSTDHNTKGLTKAEKKHVESVQRRVNQGAKYMLQTDRPATSRDGNRKAR